MFQTIARRMGRAILLSLALVVMAGAASADTEVTLEVNAGKTVTLARPATTVFVANPEIADVQAPTNGASFFVFGKAPGRTSVFALGADGKPMVSYSVEVTHSLADLKRRLTSPAPRRPGRPELDPRRHRPGRHGAQPGTRRPPPPSWSATISARTSSSSTGCG